MRTMQREKLRAAEEAQFAINNGSSSGDGNHFHELSYSGANSQPGIFTSLSRNVFGYSKATPSEQQTSCPTAAGCEGSQSSNPDRSLPEKFLYMDFYNPDPEFSGVSPDGRAERSAPADVSAAAAAGRPSLPAKSPFTRGFGAS